MARLVGVPSRPSRPRQPVSGDTAIKFVPWKLHTPLLLGDTLHAPDPRADRFGRFLGNSPRPFTLAMLWLALLLFTEYFYVHDIASGVYERFKTTLKWWPWISAGALMTLGPFVLERASRRWVRIAGIIFCLYPCFYVIDLWRPFLGGPKDSRGQLEGTNFLTRNEFPRLMLGRLKVEKPGVVIERPDREGAFTNQAVLPLLAGQRMWLGWYNHELLWRDSARTSAGATTGSCCSTMEGCPMPANGCWARESTMSSGTETATRRSCGSR